MDALRTALPNSGCISIIPDAVQQRQGQHHQLPGEQQREEAQQDRHSLRRVYR